MEFLKDRFKQNDGLDTANKVDSLYRLGKGIPGRNTSENELMPHKFNLSNQRPFREKLEAGMVLALSFVIGAGLAELALKSISHTPHTPDEVAVTALIGGLAGIWAVNMVQDTAHACLIF